jgi:hypothetical protein
VSVPKLVRYFDLAGDVDVDPITTQPAADAFGPLVTGLGQRVSIGAWVVGADGRKLAPAGLEVSLAIVWVWRVETDSAPAGSTVTNDMWSRGPIATDVIPGEELTQSELGDVVGFQVVVTAKSASPAGQRLAIYATLGPRK